LERTSSSPSTGRSGKTASDPRARRLATAYLQAKTELVRQGFAEEIDWQNEVCLAKASESTILREAAWVILSSGMRESVIRARFDAISQAFLGWRSCRAILSKRDTCRVAALAIFAHTGKIDAILGFCERLRKMGVETFKEQLREAGPMALQQFPYLGPATSFHLAKNLGVLTVKPDRHLLRLASALKEKSPAVLCEKIGLLTSDPVSVVDLVLWRFATLRRDYVDWFRQQAAAPQRAKPKRRRQSGPARLRTRG
jgi:hypothetical protein